MLTIFDGCYDDVFFFFLHFPNEEYTAKNGKTKTTTTTKEVKLSIIFITSSPQSAGGANRHCVKSTKNVISQKTKTATKRKR